MVDRLIAIPVTQGDAFFVEANGRSILVDGGRATGPFPQLFKLHTGLAGVDILVCTHNDADHALGVLGFLKAGLGCGELWLPTTWLETLANIPPDPCDWAKAVRELVEHALEKYRDNEDPIGAFGSEISHTTDYTPSPKESPGPTGATIDSILAEKLSSIDGYASLLDEWPHPNQIRYRPYYLPYTSGPGILNTPEIKAYLAAWQATERIVRIALEALNRGIRIRCYRHVRSTGFAKVPHAFPLVPLNCVPTATLQPLKAPMTAEMILSLTVANRESLSFWLKPAGAHPGVLFTADTDLDPVALPIPMAGAIVTAPHHGSVDNKNVYTAIQDEVVWVRSDGFSRTRPCPEYLTAKGTRFCTLCRGSGQSKQAIRLERMSGRWQPRCTRPCTCRR
jgi:hypothetical protein